MYDINQDNAQRIEFVVELWFEGELVDVDVCYTLRDAYAAAQNPANRVAADLIVIVEDGIEIDRYTLIGSEWIDGLITLKSAPPPSHLLASKIGPGGLEIDITIEDAR
jgi:hypothetical protein